MSIHVLGLNHQTAPVSLRERVAFSGDATVAALAALRALPRVHEAALLSTCNRTELYAMTDDDGQSLADWLAEYLVRWRDHPRAADLVLRAVPAGPDPDMVAFEVVDTGVGIAEEDAAGGRVHGFEQQLEER